MHTPRWILAAVLVFALPACSDRSRAAGLEPSPLTDAGDSALGPALTMTLSASPNVLTANGTSTSLITATLLDAGGRPLTGASVGFVTGSPNLQLAFSGAKTNCVGQATVAVAALAAGTQTVFGTYRDHRMASVMLSGSCPGALRTPISWPALTASNPGLGTVADLNGDGYVDLVVLNNSTNALNLYLSNRNGTFSPAISVPSSSALTAAVAGDFNGDGKADIAAFGDSAVQIFVGNGNATLTQVASYTAAYSRSAAVADFNLDGKPDLAYTNQLVNGILVLMGNGNASFSGPSTFPSGNNPVQIAVADFNRDGLPDVAAACYNSAQVQVLFGNGTGLGSANIVGSLTQAVGMATGDFNGDGLVDIAAYGQAGTLRVYLGNGNTTFQAPSSYSPPGYAYLLSAVDLDRDGRTDLVGGSATSLYVYQGTPGGLTSSPALYAVAASGMLVLPGDFDGDGFTDLALPTTTYSVSAFTNSGDGNLKQTPNFSTGAGPWASVLADVNKDGNVDVLSVNGTDNTWSVNLGNGDGFFQPPSAFATGATPRSLVAADFDLDSNMDVAVVNNANASVSIYYG